MKRPVISLFSGAMGLDLGLEAAGLDIALALECSPFPVATIARNRPSLPLIDKPIEEVSSSEILKTTRLEPGLSRAERNQTKGRSKTLPPQPWG